MLSPSVQACLPGTRLAGCLSFALQREDPLLRNAGCGISIEIRRRVSVCKRYIPAMREEVSQYSCLEVNWVLTILSRFCYMDAAIRKTFFLQPIGYICLKGSDTGAEVDDLVTFVGKDMHGLRCIRACCSHFYQAWSECSINIKHDGLRLLWCGIWDISRQLRTTAAYHNHQKNI